MGTFKYGTRVRETSVSTGPGPWALAGAISSYKTVSSALDDTDFSDFIIRLGDDWVSFEGEYDAGTGELAVRSIHETSNGDTDPISFGAGVKDIIMELSAKRAENLLRTDSAQTIPDGGAQARVNIGAAPIVDFERQSALLSIYQSKSFAEYRRGVDRFATGFKGASNTLNGINAGDSSNFTVTPGTAGAMTGYVAPTPGAASLVSQAAGTQITDNFDTNLSAARDGNTNQSNANSATTSSSPTVSRIGIDYGSGVTKVITGMKTWGSNNQGYGASGFTGTVALVLKASNTDPTSTGWTGTTIGIIATFLNSAATNAKETLANPNSTAYRYVWLEITTGSAIGQRVAELEFWEAGTPTNMTLVTASQTADASVSNGRVLIEFDNTAAPTLNTDLTVEVTCDGGSNWASASLSSVSTNGQGGRKIAETVDQSCTGGTSFAARIKTLNNKNVPIYGVSVTVR
ncbi:MAG: hypothetical protein Q8M26_08670 [Pseudolabrys sp.]|nr:hypothetical protein [Pseudolabrys sp.]